MEELRDAVESAKRLRKKYRCGESSFRQMLDNLIDSAESILAQDGKGILPEKKEEHETCTGCGGAGRTPNHPHILAKTCKRCNGSGKIERVDYKQFNAAIDETKLRLIANRTTREKINTAIAKHICQVNTQPQRFTVKYTELIDALFNLGMVGKCKHEGGKG